MDKNSTGYYVVKAVAGLATVLLGGAAVGKGIRPADPKGFNETMKQGARNTIDGAKGIYNNQKKKFHNPFF